MGYRANSIQELQEIAAAYNCSLEQGGPNILLLDLDSTASVKQYAENIGLVREKFGVRETDRWESRSGNLHVRLEIEAQLDVPSRLALQTALGSDPTRTIIAIREWLDLQTDTISLFRPIRLEEESKR